MMSRMLLKHLHLAGEAEALALADPAVRPAGGGVTGKSLGHKYFWKLGLRPGFFFAQKI
tara:strand:- start:830 stop:1006 length:177 start_codon:yes stop_codon:yes gene_type:complete